MTAWDTQGLSVAWSTAEKSLTVGLKYDTNLKKSFAGVVMDVVRESLKMSGIPSGVDPIFHNPIAD